MGMQKHGVPSKHVRSVGLIDLPTPNPLRVAVRGPNGLDAGVRSGSGNETRSPIRPARRIMPPAPTHSSPFALSASGQVINETAAFVHRPDSTGDSARP
jgi:hypothetical protein